MKKSIICIWFIVTSVNSFCQQIIASNPDNLRVTGNISIPALQSLKVNNKTGTSLEFSVPADFTNGKEILSFFNIEVKSNVPWVLTARAGNDNFNTLSAGAPNVPVSILSIKGSDENLYLPLSSSDVNIKVNSNDLLTNRFTVDLKINPSWNYPGGLYDVNIIFTLTPQ
jgi:hypothetical protein